MKIVIAPDSFKESLSAEKCCQAIKAGFSTLFPDANYICLPIADGGEGTVDAMVAATGGNIVTLEVCGPMGEKVNAFYGLTGDGKTAVIEMAAASGLMLVAPEKRNPLLASSFGTGELIRRWITAFAILFSALVAVRRSTVVWAWRRRSVCVSLMPTVRCWWLTAVI